jgi:hypothetical protein
LDHSILNSEKCFGQNNGLLTPLRRRSHKQKVLTLSWFLLTQLIKLFGRLKGFQLIEFLSKTLLLSFPATDIHFLLIHNFKVKNGLKVKKEVI